MEKVKDPAALHIPVLLSQVLDALNPLPDGKYLDATLGLGGHAEAILKKAANSRICGLDRDEEALALARQRLQPFAGRVHYFHLPFSSFPAALQELGWDGIDGALADLGISSMQLDKPDRGFSFLQDGPLDMRMDPSGENKSAAEIVNWAPFEELKNLISLYGEDPQAVKIARHIVNERQSAPIRDTRHLAEVVAGAYPAVWRRKARRHPATRTFQALRIRVNDELGQLESFLSQILPCIKPGGRLVIISFHSLEDRIVKNTMRRWAQGCICPPTQVKCDCGHRPEVRILYKKPLVATGLELEHNPRASSAKLRAVEKLAAI